MNEKSLLIDLLDFKLRVCKELDIKLSHSDKNETGTWEDWSVKDLLAQIGHWLNKDIENIEIAIRIVAATL